VVVSFATDEAWDALLGVKTTEAGIEDHVWFEDRWMVASWCDE
jgi:hypothetical protein